MELTEITSPGDADLPIAAFRAQLRLGSGFTDDASADGHLAQFLRAALAAIEGRCGKVLLTRGFRLVLPGWRWPDAQALPVAPVTAVSAVVLIDATGGEAAVSAAHWRLEPDRHRPQLVATGAVLPSVPQAGAVRIEFSAGFGAGWDAVPGDLAQAVMLLAAQYYEGRNGGEAVPGTLEPLLARWMPLRITAGGHR